MIESRGNHIKDIQWNIITAIKSFFNRENINYKEVVSILNKENYNKYEIILLNKILKNIKKEMGDEFSVISWLDFNELDSIIVILDDYLWWQW